MKDCDLNLTEKNLLLLKGNLMVSNVFAVRKKGENFIDSINVDKIRVDLNLINEVDSSCLSLFSCWARYAKMKNKKITFFNLTKQIKNLVAVNGLEDILPIS